MEDRYDSIASVRYQKTVLLDRVEALFTLFVHGQPSQGPPRGCRNKEQDLEQNGAHLVPAYLLTRDSAANRPTD